jgi:hypothetical protein
MDPMTSITIVIWAVAILSWLLVPVVRYASLRGRRRPADPLGEWLRRPLPDPDAPFNSIERIDACTRDFDEDLRPRAQVLVEDYFIGSITTDRFVRLIDGLEDSSAPDTNLTFIPGTSYHAVASARMNEPGFQPGFAFTVPPDVGRDRYHAVVPFRENIYTIEGAGGREIARALIERLQKDHGPDVPLPKPGYDYHIQLGPLPPKRANVYDEYKRTYHKYAERLNTGRIGIH